MHAFAVISAIIYYRTCVARFIFFSFWSIVSVTKNIWTLTSLIQYRVRFSVTPLIYSNLMHIFDFGLFIPSTVCDVVGTNTAAFFGHSYHCQIYECSPSTASEASLSLSLAVKETMGVAYTVLAPWLVLRGSYCLMPQSDWLPSANEMLLETRHVFQFLSCQLTIVNTSESCECAHLRSLNPGRVVPLPAC